MRQAIILQKQKKEKAETFSFNVNKNKTVPTQNGYAYHYFVNKSYISKTIDKNSINEWQAYKNCQQKLKICKCC